MAVIITHLSGSFAGQQKVIAKEALTFGRAADNDVVFSPQDLRASSHHAALLLDGEAYVVEDLNSTNGTYLNGMKVKRAVVKSGDTIEFGRKGPKVLIKFAASEEGQDAVSQPVDQTLSSITVASVPPGEAGRESGSHRLGRTTVQLMIDSALKKSSTRFRRTIVALVVLAAVSIVVSLYFAVFNSQNNSSSTSPNDAGFSRVAGRNQAAVVLIRNSFQLFDETNHQVREGISEGTGFAVDAKGQIITNYHIVRPWEVDPQLQSHHLRGMSKSMKVIFADKTLSEAVDAELVRGSKESDLAILKIVPSGPIPVVEGMEADVSKVRQGDEVAVIGFPLGSSLLQTTGQSRATTTLQRTAVSKVGPSIIQLDAPAFQGFSGSPIFNREGKVIGVLTARLGELGEPLDPSARSIGLGTPIRFVMELLQEGQ
jgi:S1-C subfamily serine protease